MANHVLWNSYQNFDDWKDDLRAEYPKLSDDELYRIMDEDNYFYLEDERINLDIELDGEILAIADLGLWNGRRCGYKVIGTNISDCLYSLVDCATEIEWYVDRYKNLRATESHHDGTNYYTYRMLKPNLSEEQIENFKEKLYYGTATSGDITRYTKRIGDKIAEVYGW